MYKEEDDGRRMSRIIDAMCVGVADTVGRGRRGWSVWPAIVWTHQGNESSRWTCLAITSQEILSRMMDSVLGGGQWTPYEEGDD